jgi:hypothetical protein
MPAGATAVYPGVRRHRMVEAFVAENLSHSFKPAGLIDLPWFSGPRLA